MKKCVITAATALSALLLCSAVARAAETTCSGTLTGGTYDNIVVPFNQVCVLDGVRVTGKGDR